MNYSIKGDYLGAVAGFLCLVHCVATPFLFIVKSCASTCCTDTPVWWQLIDYLFLIVSFFAIYQSTKTTQKSWVKVGLWVSWTILGLIILNEQFQVIYLAKEIIYIPSILIVVLHLYNLKYCQCAKNECCI